MTALFNLRPLIRKRWRSIGQFLGLFGLCCFLVISCGSPSGSGPSGPANSGVDPDRIAVGTTAKIRTLDPADAYELITNNLLYNLSDRLYTYEPGTTELQPQLATALPQVSPDGLIYTVPLREGVVFHDNTPFNAEAMAFSLQRFIANGGSPSSLLADVIDTVTPSGDYELTIRLKQPFAAFPALLAAAGTCAVSPQAYTIGPGQFEPDIFVGTGPYRLTAYSSDSLKLDVFEDYWGEKPANQGIDWQIFTSSANLFNAFRIGAVDVAYQSLDPDQIRTLKDGAAAGGWQVIEGIGNGIHYLTLNLLSPPLDQVAVRRAIAAVVDRPILQERVFQGQVEPLYSLLPTTLEAYEPVFREQYGDGNLNEALDLLSQAGYTASNPLTAELWYRSNLTSNELAASTLKAYVQQNMKGMMAIQLRGVESATAYQNLDKGIYPAFMLDWIPDFLDPDNYIQPFLACAQGSAATGCQEGAAKGQGSFYYSDRVNQLIAQERREQDSQVRQQIFAEIQTILAEDVPFIPLWQNKEFLFVQKGVEDARLEPTQQVPLWTLHKS